MAGTRPAWAWAWSPFSVLLHPPSLHQGLQGRQHAPGPVPVVPAGLARRRLLQPHRLLPRQPAASADLHGGVLCPGRLADPDAVLLLQVQETHLAGVRPHQLCAPAPDGVSFHHHPAEQPWPRGRPKRGVPGADTAVGGAGEQALHQAGNHWLCHRLHLQPAVPAVPAAADPHQLSAEVDPRRLLLAVRAGDAGEPAVRAERAVQKPRGGPERGQLPAAPPALARGQPGHAAARLHHILPGARGGRCSSPPFIPSFQGHSSWVPGTLLGAGSSSGQELSGLALRKHTPHVIIT
ncbi:lysosomal amino acid transporter 1 homolog isoform X2 [Tamandua tetradactyla]|uniref:lysosomal amino acid transporter 1 homolog isoform X2 n=1 Tax=Tamandua tetradactyla TaxID=48850 RepID=UPI0040538B41